MTTEEHSSSSHVHGSYHDTITRACFMSWHHYTMATLLSSSHVHASCHDTITQWPRCSVHHMCMLHVMTPLHKGHAAQFITCTCFMSWHHYTRSTLLSSSHVHASCHDTITQGPRCSVHHTCMLHVMTPLHKVHTAQFITCACFMSWHHYTRATLLTTIFEAPCGGKACMPLPLALG